MKTLVIMLNFLSIVFVMSMDVNEKVGRYSERYTMISPDKNRCLREIRIQKIIKEEEFNLWKNKFRIVSEIRNLFADRRLLHQKIVRECEIVPWENNENMAHKWAMNKWLEICWKGREIAAGELRRYIGQQCDSYRMEASRLEFKERMVLNANENQLKKINKFFKFGN